MLAGEVKAFSAIFSYSSQSLYGKDSKKLKSLHIFLIFIDGYILGLLDPLSGNPFCYGSFENNWSCDRDMRDTINKKQIIVDAN